MVAKETITVLPVKVRDALKLVRLQPTVALLHRCGDLILLDAVRTVDHEVMFAHANVAVFRHLQRRVDTDTLVPPKHLGVVATLAAADDEVGFLFLTQVLQHLQAFFCIHRTIRHQELPVLRQVLQYSHGRATVASRGRAMQIHQFLGIVRHLQGVVLLLEVLIRMDQALAAHETNTIGGYLLRDGQRLLHSVLRHTLHLQHILTAKDCNQGGCDPVTGTFLCKAAKAVGALLCKAAWNSDFRKKHIMKTDKEKKQEQAEHRALETQRKVDQIYAVVKIVCISSLIVGVIMFLLHLKRRKEKEATLAQLTIADAGSDD